MSGSSGAEEGLTGKAFELFPDQNAFNENSNKIGIFPGLTSKDIVYSNSFFSRAEILYLYFRDGAAPSVPLFRCSSDEAPPPNPPPTGFREHLQINQDRAAPCGEFARESFPDLIFNFVSVPYDYSSSFFLSLPPPPPHLVESPSRSFVRPQFLPFGLGWNVRGDSSPVAPLFIQHPREGFARPFRPFDAR